MAGFFNFFKREKLVLHDLEDVLPDTKVRSVKQAYEIVFDFKPPVCDSEIMEQALLDLNFIIVRNNSPIT